jgi:excisionase family DNA binding protein
MASVRRSDPEKSRLAPKKSGRAPRSVEDGDVSSGKGRGRGRDVIPERPPFYTGQDVARFCQVDLKTVHHWADRGRIAHHRTEGRHLRFRRNDVLGFLRTHRYPLPAELCRVRCVVSLALAAEAWSLPTNATHSREPGEASARADASKAQGDHGASLSADEALFDADAEARKARVVSVEDVFRKLDVRFAVHRYGSGVSALVHLMVVQPDVLVLDLEDPGLAGARTIAGLKRNATTSWLLIVAIGPESSLDAARAAGADVTLTAGDVGRLVTELVRTLAMTG